MCTPTVVGTGLPDPMSQCYPWALQNAVSPQGVYGGPATPVWAPTAAGALALDQLYLNQVLNPQNPVSGTTAFQTLYQSMWQPGSPAYSSAACTSICPGPGTLPFPVAAATLTPATAASASPDLVYAGAAAALLAAFFIVRRA